MAVVLLGVMLAFQGIDGLQGVEGRSPGDLEKLLNPTQGERLPDDLDNIDGAQDVPADNRPGKVASPAGFGDPFPYSSAQVSAEGGYVKTKQDPEKIIQKLQADVSERDTKLDHLSDERDAKSKAIKALPPALLQNVNEELSRAKVCMSEDKDGECVADSTEADATESATERLGESFDPSSPNFNYVTVLSPNSAVGPGLGNGGPWTSLEDCVAAGVAKGYVAGDTLGWVQHYTDGYCYLYGQGSSNCCAGSNNWRIDPATTNCYPMMAPNGATELGSCSKCPLADALSYIPGYGYKDSAMSQYSISGHAVDTTTGCGACPDGMHAIASVKVSDYYASAANLVVDANGALVDDVVLCRKDDYANWFSSSAGHGMDYESLKCFPMFSSEMYAGKDITCVKYGNVTLDNVYDDGGVYPDGTGPGAMSSYDSRWVVKCRIWKIVTCSSGTCHSAKRVTFTHARMGVGSGKSWDNTALSTYSPGVCQGAAASA